MASGISTWIKKAGLVVKLNYYAGIAILSKFEPTSPA
jgi:hypothetical protein